MNKKLIFILGVCVILGLLIPMLAEFKQFYYLLLLAIAGLIILAVRRARVTAYDWLLLIIFTIPFHTLRVGGEVNFLRLSEIAFIPFFFWCLADKSRGPLKIRKEFFMLLGFLVINILATSKSMYPLVSIKRIFIIAYLGVFAYLLSITIKDDKRMFFAARAMIIISAFSAVLAFLQSFLPQLHILPTRELVSFAGITLYRGSAGWKDPNYYALYLVMNTALTLSFLFSKVLQEKRWLKLCLVLQLAGVLATFSRMGLICLIGVFLYILFVYGHRRTAVVLVLVFLAVLVSLAYSVDYIYEKYPLLKAYFYREPQLEMLKKYPHLILVQRWDAYRANWRMFLDNPFLGVGPFMSSENYGRYRPADAVWPAREMLASHNQYLQLLSEKGIFGFIFFMGFIFMILRRLAFFIKKYRDTESGMILIGLSAAIIAYLAGSLVAETTHEVQFWLTIGLSLALFNILEQREESLA